MTHSPAVLIIDDEPLVRTLVVRILQRTHLNARAASSGEEGLEFYHAEPSLFAVALVDLTMPGISGFEVLTELRDHRPELPVVFMSGYSEQEIHEDQRTLFLKKPFRPKDLLDAIQTVAPHLEPHLKR